MLADGFVAVRFYFSGGVLAVFGMLFMSRCCPVEKHSSALEMWLTSND